LSSGIGAAGTGVTSLTGSPLLGGATKTALGTGINGGDVGAALTNYGTNAAIGAGTSYLNNLMGTSNIPNNSPLGLIKNAATTSLTDAIKGGNQPPSRPASILTSAPKSLTASLLQKNTAPTLLQSNPTGSTSPLASGNTPPQKVDVSTLKPVADISSLLGKKI
jgi:hypothetical protein